MINQIIIQPSQFLILTRLPFLPVCSRSNSFNCINSRGTGPFCALCNNRIYKDGHSFNNLRNKSWNIFPHRSWIIVYLPENHLHISRRAPTPNTSVNISVTGGWDKIITMTRLEFHLLGRGGKGSEKIIYVQFYII